MVNLSALPKLAYHAVAQKKLPEATIQSIKESLTEDTLSLSPEQKMDIPMWYRHGPPEEKIPNVAHFIWLSAKNYQGGTLYKSIPQENLLNILRFKALNPHFQVKLWTDAPHLMQQAMLRVDDSARSKIEVAQFFKLFSSSQWEGFSSEEKETVQTAVLRELHRGNRNPQAGKDITQLVVLKHEPGWYFDMDATFHKALPETYADISYLFYIDNGIMAFSETGKPYLDKLLKGISSDYDIRNDVAFSKKEFEEIKKQLKIEKESSQYGPFKYLNRSIRMKSCEKNLAEASILRDPFFKIETADALNRPDINAKGFLDNIYLMLDLKGNGARRHLTDKICLRYNAIVGSPARTFWQALLDHKVFDMPECSVFSEDPTVESWQHLPKLRRRASSVDLPSFISEPKPKILDKNG